MFQFETIDEFIDYIKTRAIDDRERAKLQKTKKAEAEYNIRAAAYESVVHIVENSNLVTNCIVVAIDEEVQYALDSCDKAVEWLDDLKDDIRTIQASIELQREQIKRQFKIKEPSDG